MIINSITLDNFKSHKHSHIDLNNGISLILGENGAGKSSIFEAISYAFFKTFTGKTDNLRRKPSNEKDIVTKMIVTIEFENGTKHYKLIRGKDKKSNVAKLYEKNNDTFSIICEGDKKVTNEIESLLDLDQKSFMNAVYIKQGDITELIEKTASERKEFIAKLLNIDSINKAWEESKNLVKIYEDKVSSYQDNIKRKEKNEKIIEESEEKIKEKQEKLDQYIIKKEKLSEKIKDLEIKVLKLENEKQEYENLTNKHAQIQKFIKKLEEEENTLENKIKEIEYYENKCIELKKYQDQLPHLKTLKEEENRINEYTKDLKSINEKIDDIHSNMKVINNKRKYYYDYENVKNEIESLHNQRKELQNRVNENQKIEIKLENCHAQNKEHINYIRDTSGLATKIFNDNFNNPEEVEKKVTEEKEKIENSISVLTKKINDNNKDISSIKNDLTRTKKSLQDLENTQDTCPICQSAISHEKHEELSKKYKDNILNLEIRIEELEEANKNQNKKLKESEEYLSKIQEINILKLKEEYFEFNKILKEIKELEKDLPKVDEDKTSLDEMDKKIKEKNNYLENLESQRSSYLVAVDIVKKYPKIEELESEQKKLDIKMSDLKFKCRDIIQQYNIQDNLDKTIEYAEKQTDTFNRYQGIIQTKESTLEQKQNMIKNIEEEENNLKEINSKINNLSYDEEKYKSIQDTYTSQQEEIDKIKIKINTKEVEIKDETEYKKRRKEEIEDINNKLKKQESILDFIKTLTEIRKIYSKDGIQKVIREAAKPNIEQSTNNIFNEFDFDYSSLKLDENYDIKVENNSGELELDMMSGGEKIVIALALRLGIAQVVSQKKTELLMLDEPTIHLDEERRASLIDIIGKISIVPQMIVVTHDDEMESLSNNIIKIAKKDGISYISES